MKNSKPETHATQTRRHQLIQWLTVTGGVMTPGGMIPTTVFSAADGGIDERLEPGRRARG